MQRVDKLIANAIHKFDLKLDSLLVLTEAANGLYFVTPIIAALAGARVIAIAKDSKYGSAQMVIDYVRSKAVAYNVEEKIDFVTGLSVKDISSADIITNLGFVRPINRQFVNHIKPKAVISLFCELWEVRKNDVDINACHEREIMVLGTNEETAELNVFKNVGPLILKMLFEAGLEVYQNEFLILSNDKFGDTIQDTLLKNGSKAELLSVNSNTLIPSTIHNLDAIIVADYTFEDIIIGANGIISADEISQRFPGVLVLQFAGRIIAEDLDIKKIHYFPKPCIGAHRMARTFDYLGPKPMIDLHTAGLKVGFIGASALRDYTSHDAIIKRIMNHPLCQLV